MNNHDGHRLRIRSKIDEEGFYALSEAEKLEYFLYPFIPRKNTHYEATKAIELCGDLHGIFLFDPVIFESIPNIKPCVLTALRRLHKIGVDYDRFSERNAPDINSKCKVNKYAIHLFNKYPHHEVFIIFVDKQVRVKRVHAFYKDDFSSKEDIISKILDLKWGIAICIFRFTTKEFAIKPYKFALTLREKGVVILDLIFLDKINRKRHYDKSIQPINVDFILNSNKFNPDFGRLTVPESIMID